MYKAPSPQGITTQKDDTWRFWVQFAVKGMLRETYMKKCLFHYAEHHKHAVNNTTEEHEHF